MKLRTRLGFVLGTLVSFSAMWATACGPTKETEVPNPNTASSGEDAVAYGEGPPMPTGTTNGSGPHVNEGSAKSHDVYDKESTDVVLARAARSVKDSCGHAAGEDGKATGPWGKVTLQVMLGHNGHGKGVTVPEPYASTPSGKCIEKAFSQLTFPPWNGQDTQVDWEVELVKPSAADSKPAKGKK